MSSANAIEVPSKNTAAMRICVTRDIWISSGSGRCLTRLEKVADRKLEDDGLLAGQGLERDAPLEAQGPDRREPAETEAPALTVRGEVEGIEAGVLAVIHHRRFDLAVLIFEVEGVAHVGEHDTS